MIGNRLITRADLPNIAGMLGNSANSWDNDVPNDLFIKGVAKCIFIDAVDPKLTNGGNIGGGLDTIFVKNIPALSLKNNFDFLDLDFGGDFATNDNDKRLNVSYNGTTQEDTGLIDIDANVGWRYLARVIRLSSTSVLINSVILGNAIATSGAEVLVAFATGSVMITRSTILTGLSSLDTNALTIEVKAEGTANDDIIINQAVIHLTRF